MRTNRIRRLAAGACLGLALAACAAEPQTEHETKPQGETGSETGQPDSTDQEPSTLTSEMAEERSDGVEDMPVDEPALASAETEAATSPDEASAATPATDEVATFGAGCFWCVEAVLEQLDGVKDVTSGYMGGEVPNPTYKAVCTGTTGHAEVVQVTFDPSVISYESLLDWFWRLHDPTTLNRQGADRGTQYRSAIFYHSEEQKKTAEASLAAAQPSFSDPIVTEITEAGEYYEAEDYHQDYYRQNKRQGYCRMVIAPKLQKLKLED